MLEVTDPMPPVELPELPLGMTLGEHVKRFLTGLSAGIELTKEAECPHIAQALRAVYEDLWRLLEFHTRENELIGAKDRLEVQGDADHSTIYILAVRNGEALTEFPMCKRMLGSFIAALQAEYELMP